MAYDKAKQRAYYLQNKERILATAKLWAENNKARDQFLHRDARLRRVYGISQAEFEARLAGQGNACAICGKSFDGVNIRDIHIDHDHSRGEKFVRGILCGPCNRMIGMCEDNVNILQEAIDYLKWAVAENEEENE